MNVKLQGKGRSGMVVEAEDGIRFLVFPLRYGDEAGPCIYFNTDTIDADGNVIFCDEAHFLKLPPFGVVIDSPMQCDACGLTFQADQLHTWVSPTPVNNRRFLKVCAMCDVSWRAQLAQEEAT